MGFKVRLSNPSKTTHKKPIALHDLQINNESNIRFDRSTYQYLGSLVKNKDIVIMYKNGLLPPEYVRTLDELNLLFLKYTNPTTHGNIVIPKGITELDEYLSQLGISEEYPYSKDEVDIPEWLEFEKVPLIRVLVDPDDYTYLVCNDSGTEETLVRIL